LLREAKFMVINRPGSDSVLPPVEGDFVFLNDKDTPSANISSTIIRSLCQRGGQIRGIVPGAVADIIEREKLYLNDKN